MSNVRDPIPFARTTGNARYEAPGLDRRAASDCDGPQNNNCRRKLQREATEQRQRVGTLCVLEPGDQRWSECEGELIDCDDNTDDPREMPFREFLLNDEARQRRR